MIACKPGSLFDTLQRKARTMTDEQISHAYAWVPSAHLAYILRQIRAAEVSQ